MSSFTVCKMEGFTSKLSIVITKGSDWDEQKTCGVFIEDHEHRSILLGLFPLAEAFDFAECISTAFQIWQYDMTIDNKEIENNG